MSASNIAASSVCRCGNFAAAYSQILDNWASCLLSLRRSCVVSGSFFVKFAFPKINYEKNRTYTCLYEKIRISLQALNKGQ